MDVNQYINSGSIRAMLPILKEWPHTLRKYIKHFNQSDCQWWYNERATLSSLAAATWSAGGVALEEYCSQKGCKGEIWSGRCDLSVSIGSATFACEAKQAWCAIGRKARTGFKSAKEGIEKAWTAAREVDCQEGRRLAICFAVPYLPVSDEPFIQDQLLEWLEKIHKKIDYDLIAWVFPAIARSLKGPDDYLYPGVVMMAQETQRGL